MMHHFTVYVENLFTVRIRKIFPKLRNIKKSYVDSDFISLLPIHCNFKCWLQPTEKQGQTIQWNSISNPVTGSIPLNIHAVWPRPFWGEAYLRKKLPVDHFIGHIPLFYKKLIKDQIH